MLSVEQARQLVLEHAACKPAARMQLSEALGLVLAEDVASDIDSPPFDKAMVDGYAVQSSDLAEGRADLIVIEEITAGQTPTRSAEPRGCWRIMTGAPVPPGADAVVMHELTEPSAPQTDSFEHVHIRDERFRVGQNILRRGTSLRSGQTVLTSGRLLRPLEIGLLAEVGRATVAVIEPARVAVLSTGSELVPPDQIPVGGQIRNSNGPMLAAWVRRAGGQPVDLGIAQDEPEQLRAKLAEGLRQDVLVISGGVSAGKLDLVPGLLRELGVAEVFHKIHLKPGKPLWFGVAKRRHPGEATSTSVCPSGETTLSSLSPSPSTGEGRGEGETLVFGLPGNPVSSLVCATLFLRPALAKLAGREPQRMISQQAALTADFTHRGDRPTFHPAMLDERLPDRPRITPVAWGGSADLRSLTDANALAIFAAGDRTYRAGESIDVVRLDG